MAKLILVRHGESVWNALGQWTGWTDIDLSDKGRKEARGAAEAIKDIPIDLAYSSKLKRAIQTFEEIKKTLNLEIPLTESQELNERNYGDLTGKNKWKIIFWRNA